MLGAAKSGDVIKKITRPMRDFMQRDVNSGKIYFYKPLHDSLIAFGGNDCLWYASNAGGSHLGNYWICNDVQ